MGTEHFDTIVVGLGAMGSAAAYHLARRGRRVLGIDQFEVPHTRGSSHGFSRAIRLCYYEHPDYVPLLKRAYALWGELERESGEKLLHLTGGLYMGSAASELVSGSLRAAREHALPHESLAPAQIAARFPQFRLPEDFTALYEPNAGFLLPERVIGVHKRLAGAHGAQVREREPVQSWRADGAGVEVRTARAAYRAANLVIAAGTWAQRVIGATGVRGLRITPTRQVLGWVRPRRPEVFALGRFPVWALADPEAGMYYGFPMAPAGDGAPAGLKLARHVPGPMIDPDQADRATTDADAEDFLPALRRYLPDGVGPVVEMRVCLYENSPDGHFVIDRHPAHANVYIAAGFSGHGFKFASVVGEVLADLAGEGATRHPIGFLGLDRFA